MKKLSSNNTDCILSITGAYLEKDKLDLSLKITCPYNEKALSPKIRLLFRQGEKTRRLPIIIDKKTADNGICTICASYRYFITELFFDSNREDISLKFSFSYADYEVDDFVITSAENVDSSKITVHSDEIIIHSNPSIWKAKHHKQYKSISSLAKNCFAVFIRIIYSVICRKNPIVQNRISFMSCRRDTLGGNMLNVYDLIKDNPDIDFQFLLYSDANGHYKPQYLKRFLQLYATSRVVIVDDYFRMLNIVPKRRGVTLFQLWHACGAFKTFGFTRLGKEGGPQQVTVNHRMYDYAIVSSSKIAKHYAEGFGLSDEKIIATGIPRTDVFADENYAAEIKERLYSKYPALMNKKVLLFAPTFRGNGQMSAYYPLDALDIQKLYDDLGGEYAIIIKLHPFCKERYKVDEKYKDCIFDFSDKDELNDLLFITDLLITDYSSVVFEASLLDIPMLFYSFDLVDYVMDRDFYYEYEYFVPGKIVCNQNELTKSIINSDFDYNKVDNFKNLFFDNFDGNSTNRVADKILSVLKGEI